MKKLTASECKDRIQYIREMIEGDTSRLSRGGQCQLQALEIALPILEQQESPTDTYRQIENDGWVEWGGGDCPVPRDLKVEVRGKNDQRAIWDHPHIWDWTHKNNESDIIAYRVIEND